MYSNINHDLKICYWCLHVLHICDEVDYFSLLLYVLFYDHDAAEVSRNSWNTS